MLTRADLARRRSAANRCTSSVATATAAAPRTRTRPRGSSAATAAPTWSNGTVGRRAAEDCFRTAGLGPTDVDVCEFYDPFSFEIIRQFEAFGFCGEGEGGDFVTSGAIEPGGQYPVTTDGGVMSYSHGGASAQMLQRVIRGVEQLRGECESNQVEGAEVAMCSNGGGAGRCSTTSCCWEWSDHELTALRRAFPTPSRSRTCCTATRS